MLSNHSSQHFLYRTYIQAKAKEIKQHLQQSNAPLDTSNNPKLQIANPSRSTQPLKKPQSNQISSILTCMSGPMMCWKLIALEKRLHKHIQIHKAIWTMLEVWCCPPPFALSFIVHFQLGSYKQYGINSRGDYTPYVS